MDMNKKTRCNNVLDHSPAHLPQEIMHYNILTRVPAESLCRFRCVCKEWYNLFYDPLFKSLYSLYSSTKDRGLICFEGYWVLVGEKETTPSFSFIDIDKKECRKIPFRLPKESCSDSFGSYTARLRVLDSLHGVLLLRLDDDLYLYNPASGFRLLISSGIEFGDYFLAYDPIILKFKVVKLSVDEYFEILTVDRYGVNPWRRVSIPSHYSNISEKPVSVNYALHWICSKKKRGRSNDSKDGYAVIIRFNVSKEKLSTIELPVKHSRKSLLGYILEMGGLLWFCYSVPQYKFQVELWYLKNKNWNGRYRDDKWVVMCNINLTTNIDKVDRMISCCASKYRWTCEPLAIVMDPKCKIIFDFMHLLCRKGIDHYSYICSYDMESTQWDLIHAEREWYEDKKRFPGVIHGPLDYHYWHSNKDDDLLIDYNYWHGNMDALST